MKIKSDLHVHTFLSPCAVRTAFPQDYITYAKEKGLRTIGFADHFWDNAIEGASGFYANQSYETLSKIKEHIPKDTNGVNVLFGCEVEYVKGKIAITPEVAKKFDFVHVTASHFHMKNFVIPASVTEAKDFADYLIRYFLGAVSSGLCNGIVHPFMPHGHLAVADSILQNITNQDYYECFTLAKNNNVSIELHSSIVSDLLEKNKDGISIAYARMVEAASACGCKFHFGLDFHNPEEMRKSNWYSKLESFVNILGLTDDMFLYNE